MKKNTYTNQLILISFMNKKEAINGPLENAFTKQN